MTITEELFKRDAIEPYSGIEECFVHCNFQDNNEEQHKITYTNKVQNNREQ